MALVYRKVTRYRCPGVIVFNGEQFLVPDGHATVAECETVWAEKLAALTEARKKMTADPLPVTAKDILAHGISTFAASHGAGVTNTYEVEYEPGLWLQGKVIGNEDGSVAVVVEPAAEQELLAGRKVAEDAVEKAAADAEAALAAELLKLDGAAGQPLAEMEPVPEPIPEPPAAPVIEPPVPIATDEPAVPTPAPATTTEGGQS